MIFYPKHIYILLKAGQNELTNDYKEIGRLPGIMSFLMFSFNSQTSIFVPSQQHEYVSFLEMKYPEILTNAAFTIMARHFDVTHTVGMKGIVCYVIFVLDQIPSPSRHVTIFFQGDLSQIFFQKSLIYRYFISFTSQVSKGTGMAHSYFRLQE